MSVIENIGNSLTGVGKEIHKWPSGHANHRPIGSTKIALLSSPGSGNFKRKTLTLSCILVKSMNTK